MSLTALMLDSAAAFCIAVSPHAAGEVMWSVMGGRIIRTVVSSSMVRDTLYLPNSDKQSRVTNIVYHPRDPTILIVGGVMMDGLYRSDDSGKSWKLVYRTLNQLLWFSGKSIEAVESDSGIVFVAASLSNGMVLVSTDDGKSWAVQGRDKISSVCSLTCGDSSHTRLLIGARPGEIYQVITHNEKVELLWRRRGDHYAEIPQILRSATLSETYYCVTVQYDNTGESAGLVVLESDGEIREFLHGVSFWAIDEDVITGNLCLGGFSEIPGYSGAGRVIILNPLSGCYIDIEVDPEWRTSMPSVWDVQTLSSSIGSHAFLVACEQGLIIMYPS